MRKKIRKASKTKKHYLIDFLRRRGIKEQAEMLGRGPPQTVLAQHQALQGGVFSDREVFSDDCLFRSKVIAQRLDNDADSDDEQIACAVKRIHRTLADATAYYAPHESRERLMNTLVARK